MHKSDYGDANGSNVYGGKGKDLVRDIVIKRSDSGRYRLNLEMMLVSRRSWTREGESFDSHTYRIGEKRIRQASASDGRPISEDSCTHQAGFDRSRLN